MVLPESALIQLRKIVRPAPDVGLYSRPSACCWTDEEAFMTVCASPNASEAPNPVIVWNVVAPLMVAVSAAAAGPAAATRPPAPSAIRPATEAASKRARRMNSGAVRGSATGPPYLNKKRSGAARGAVDGERGGRGVTAGERAGEAHGHGGAGRDRGVVRLVRHGHLLAGLGVAGVPQAGDLLVAAEREHQRPRGDRGGGGVGGHDLGLGPARPGCGHPRSGA